MISQYKKYFSELLSKFLPELSQEEILSMIEIPPTDVPWDLAFPCFKLSKLLKKSPNEIALTQFEELKNGKLKNESDLFNFFEKFEGLGWYVNAFINVESITKEVLSQILDLKENYGRGEKKNEVIVVESPGPNTNKPLHIWHIRNILLWNSLLEILKFAWFDTKRVDIINDRGIHICKSMLAYQKFWNWSEPDKKSDHFVGDRYVRYAKELENHPEMEKEIVEMLQKREKWDEETMNLRKKMNDRAINWQQVTYKRFGAVIDKAYFESDHYLHWKDLVLDFFNKWIFFKDEKWNLVFQSKEESLGTKAVLRSDWTSIYSTQDIWLAKLRYDDFHMDRMIYVVWNEQIEYFKVLFEIFHSLGFKFAEKCHHMAYGMISVPWWKMKSREGTVVDADDLADEIRDIARQELKSRYSDISAQELEVKSESIALWAIKFFMLKYEVNKWFIFDKNESLSFEGETWPYLQYSYARCFSIIEKWKNGRIEEWKSIDFNLDHNYHLKEQEEKNLIICLGQFAEVVQLSAEQYKPNLIARYLLELAKLFNNFYQKHKVFCDDENLQNARLILVECVRQVLKNWLSLLGIDTPEKM